MSFTWRQRVVGEDEAEFLGIVEWPERLERQAQREVRGWLAVEFVALVVLVVGRMVGRARRRKRRSRDDRRRERLEYS